MSHFNRVFEANELLFANPLSSVQARTTFDRSHTHKTSLDSGVLVPIYFDEVLPGDTHIISMNYLARMTTPIVPIADNAVLDFSFFFVPIRILWSEFKYFMGEARDYWASKNPPIPPQVICDTTTATETEKNRSPYWSFGGYRPSDLGAYLGLPIKNKFLGTLASGATISALPFYAYAQIWNDWFRDQNFQEPIPIDSAHISPNGSVFHPNIIYFPWPGGGTQLSNIPIIDQLGYIRAGLGLMSVSKLPDYFTTCLPSPQKGDPVTVPIGGIPAQRLEVVNNTAFNITPNTVLSEHAPFDRFAGNDQKKREHIYQFLHNSTQQAPSQGQIFQTVFKQWDNRYPQATSLLKVSNSSANHDGFLGRVYTPLAQTSVVSQNRIMEGVFHDLVAKLPEQRIESININDLRLAFTVQQFLETDARGGSRYIEILKNHFGVLSPDARLQRAEYIGGIRDYLNVQQVLATSQTLNNGIVTNIGELGAYSLTAGKMTDSIVYSSTEHGYIMGFVTVRVMHTYGQGVEKVWTRKSRYDYYWPVFDNLGEMPVYKREIAVAEISQANNSSAEADSRIWNRVFGYNEAWAEYRWAKNKVTGNFNPNKVAITGKHSYLSAWSFTDNYSTQPTLNKDWIKENKTNIEQTLAVDSTKFGTNQFLFDFFFDVKSTRAMSMFSIPGLTRM